MFGNIRGNTRHLQPATIDSKDEESTVKPDEKGEPASQLSISCSLVGSAPCDTP